MKSKIRAFINLKNTKLCKKIFLALGAAALLSSCGNSPKQNTAEPKRDSIAVNNVQLQKKIRLFKEATLSFSVDTAFLFKITKGDSLGGFEVKTLAVNPFKNSLSEGMDYGLNTFYKLDSIKEAGKYQQYIDSLDIGMTKYCTAHALNEFHLDANTLILVWGIYTSSYEACPSSVSWIVYGTVVYKGDVKETFLMGEYSVWADAPVATIRTISSTLAADGTLAMNLEQINDQDPDSTTVEVTREKYSFSIKDGAVKLVSEKKGAAVSEKRKSQN